MKLCAVLIMCLMLSLASAFVVNFPHVTKSQPRPSNTALAMAGITLYGSQGSRSPLVNWALYELGLDFSMGDLEENPHPFGQIPCLTDENDVMLFESGAILIYLSALAGPDISEKQEAQVLSWVAWANASLDPICFLETPEGKVYVTTVLLHCPSFVATTHSHVCFSSGTILA